jgi:hypothetical protein
MEDSKLALGKAGKRGVMPEVTYSVALPFVAHDGIAAGEPTECLNPIAAVMRAESLSRKEGHVRAFRRTGNPAAGDFSDAKLRRNVIMM